MQNNHKETENGLDETQKATFQELKKRFYTGDLQGLSQLTIELLFELYIFKWKGELPFSFFSVGK